jgi:hypothetical protein
MKGLLLFTFILINSYSFSQSKRKLRALISVLEIQLKEGNDSINILYKNLDSAARINYSLIFNQTVLRDSVTQLKWEIADLMNIINPSKVSIDWENTGDLFISENNKQNDDPVSYGNNSFGQETTNERFRLNDLNVDNINTDRITTVSLVMTIDENGQILTARSTSKTTTTDQRIINLVINEVKRQVRYNKAPSAPPAIVYFTIRIQPK